MNDVDTDLVRKPRRTRLVSATGGALGALAVVTGLNMAGVLGGPDGPSTAATSNGGRADQWHARPGGLADVGEPCAGAQQGKVGSLTTAVPVWLPAGRAPSRAWTCGHGKQATPVVMFGAVQVSFEPGYSRVDPRQYAQTEIRELGGHTIVIGKHTAAVIPSTGSDINHQVSMIVDGTMVRLMSEASIPIGDLVNLAMSLNLPK